MKGLLIIALAFLILSPHEAPTVWVEIHDVSPGYGTEELSKVVEVLETHRVERTVIFVMADHGGSAPLGEHPEFTDYLKELQSRGYEIGAHGYTHEGFEFYCSRGEAIRRLNLSMGEFHAAGIEPQVFLPPRFRVSDESFEVLEENFREIYLISKVVKNRESLPYNSNDFTWLPLPEWIVTPMTKASYAASRGDVYRLSIHVGDMDSERLEYLDNFLDFTDVQNT